MSIPLKVFCRILLGTTESAVDQNLRQEQAGFRRQRALKNIIVQCVEWKAPLHINFIDFWKAFDSLHHGTLWKAVRAYGIPPKMGSLMGMFYRHFECSVIVNRKPSD